MKNKTSQHILPTASNLLGLAFIVLTSLKGFSVPHLAFIDKLIALVITALAASCVLSFASIRIEEGTQRARRYETLADYLFIFSLGMIVVFSCSLAFDYFFVLH